MNPYQVVARLLADTASSGELEKVAPRQFGEAAACFAAGIAALGFEPAVDGDSNHWAVQRGHWLLELLRRVELPDGGGPDA